MSESDSKIITFDELKAWAADYVKTLKPGDSVSLAGPLGAGKTSLTRALVTSLGMLEHAAFGSPTFSVMNIYEAEGLKLRHLDLYRLETFSAFEGLDLQGELRCPGSISFVEWGDKFSELKEGYTHFIRMDFVPDSDDARMIETWRA